MAEGGNADAPWLEMVDRTACGEGRGKVRGDEVSVAVPETDHRLASAGGSAGVDEEQGINIPERHIPTGTTAAAPPSPPPIRKMRTSGLRVFLILFLSVFIWPILIFWEVIWWTVYSFWAIHYIYLSTRRPRAIAQAHSGATSAQQPARLPLPENAILITTEITATTELRADRNQPSGSGTPRTAVFDDEDTKPYEYTATVTAGGGTEASPATPCAETRTAGELNSFHPQVGKNSRKIKALLEYEWTMPIPKSCRAALLAAERKRIDILDCAAGVGRFPRIPLPVSLTTLV